MGKNRKGLNDYENRVMSFMVSHMIRNKVPPTFEEIIENVEGAKSKSTVFYHLNRMKELGYLTQKGTGTMYVPTFMDEKELLVPRETVRKACRILLEAKTEEAYGVAKELASYMK